MVDDNTKKGLLEWLFGKSSLDKAAGIPPQQKPVAPQTVPQNNDYLKKQVERKVAEDKAQKDAMDKLKKVQ